MSGASPTPDDPFDTPEKAYAEAERLIAEAKAQGSNATELRVQLRLLERLPPSIAGLTALQSLDLSGTRVADLAPLTKLTSLQRLDLDGTRVADLAPLAGLTALRHLDLDGTQIADLAPLAGLTALQDLSLNRTPVADLAPLAGLTALQDLDLDGTPVADLAPLAGLTALQSLWLDGTPVADLAPLAGLTALQSLWLDRTPVADLAPLAGLTALQRLRLTGTQVADLAPLAGLTALQSLWLTGTQVADLAPLAGLTALQSLWLTGTQVADLAPLAGLTALQRLDLDRTQAADLAPLAGLTALQSLSLDRTQAADLAPLAGLTALQSLWLTGTQVADLAPLAGLTALQRLDLDRTQAADLAPLAGLTALQSLSLDRTQAADLAPLAGLTALQRLWLTGTPVADLAPLAGLTALQSLWLTGTQVADLAPLAGMTAMIDVVHAAWSDEKNSALRSQIGLTFKNSKVAEREPFKRFAALKDPHRTIETINYLRREQGMREHVPTGYQKPDDPKPPVPPQPPLPQQANAIRFVVPQDGPIGLDRGALLPDADRQKLNGMQAEMLEALEELTSFVERSNGFAYLKPHLQKYKTALDHPAIDLHDGDVEILYARGIRFQIAYDDLVLEIARGDAPEPDRRLKAPLFVLLKLHGPLLLATNRGRELYDHTDRDLRTRDVELDFKKKQVEINQAIRAEAHAVVIPAAMEEHEAATDMIAVGPHPEKAAAAGRAANRNFALAWSELAGKAHKLGLNVPNVTAGVVGSVIAGKLPAIGAAVGGLSGLPLSLIAANFMIRHASDFRDLAKLGGPSFEWLRIQIDWLVARHSRSPEKSD